MQETINSIESDMQGRIEAARAGEARIQMREKEIDSVVTRFLHIMKARGYPGAFTLFESDAWRPFRAWLVGSSLVETHPIVGKVLRCRSCRILLEDGRLVLSVYDARYGPPRPGGSHTLGALRKGESGIGLHILQ